MKYRGEKRTGNKQRLKFSSLEDKKFHSFKNYFWATTMCLALSQAEDTSANNADKLPIPIEFTL